MANITAADVKKLRDLTGAGMMDCKKALDEADGDFDKAVELLRIKGAARPPSAAPSASRRQRPRRRRRRRAGRAAAARPTSWPRTTTSRRSARRSRRPPTPRRPADREALLAADAGRRPAPSAEAIDALAAVIGEKLELGRVAVLRRSRSRSTCTSAPPTCPPQVGVLVAYDRRRGRGPRRGHAGRRHAPAVPHPRRGPGRRRRERAAHRRGDRPRGGQARGGAAQDRRGPGQRLLQGRRAARAAVVQDSKKTVAAGARRGRRRRSPGSPGSRSARPEPR